MNEEGDNCFGCAATLTENNNSVAHVIPNALGGRLKISGALCRACNSQLDDLADNALVRAFGAWPTLLNLTRDRGKNPPKMVETKGGLRLKILPDGSAQPHYAHYEIKPAPGGIVVGIGASDKRTLKSLLRRAEKHVPGFSRERHLVTKATKEIEVEPFFVPIDFSPPEVFGGVASIIWLYLICVTGQAYADWSYLKNFIAAAQMRGEPFRYYVDGLPGLNGPEIPLSHKIVIRLVPETREVVAFVEIMGVLRIGGVIAHASEAMPPFEFIYVFDLDEGSERSEEFSIDAQIFGQQEWQSVGLGLQDGEALQDHFNVLIPEVLGAGYQRRATRSAG